MPIVCKINGVDVSTHLKGVDAMPGGDGLVGQGRLYLDQDAGGMDIRTIHSVQVYQTFNAAGSGIAPGGRLFGGHVNNRDTGNIGVTKVWALNCWDYNIILDRTVRDASPSKAITLTAGHFNTQITSLVTQIQQNGFGVVNTQIDTTIGVADLYATMPAVTYPGGKKLGWYIQQLCNTAQSLNSALIPHFYMGLDPAFGIGAVFGNPVLYVYNGAALPAIGLSFSDVVAGGRKPIFGKFRRVTDATTTIQRRQAFFSDAHLIVTSANATMQAAYPWPYINHGGASNTGYLMSEVIEDNDSATFAQAQQALDQRNATESVPVDSFEFETEERVQPGDMIGVGYALESIADDTPYRVVKVQTRIEPPEVINSKLTINSRRLTLFDDGSSVYAPPVEGDVVPPLPATAFSVTSNYYDGDTGDANMIFAIGASPSPDVVGYAIRGRVGHARVDTDVETNLAPALIFPSGLAYDLQVFAYDRTRNYSEGFPAVSLTGTTAVPVYDEVPNKDLDVPDRVDGTLHRYWTRTVVNGGAAVYNTASNTGAGCVLLSTSATGGSSASYTSAMTVVKGPVYATQFVARSNSGTPSLAVFYDWYDNTQAFLSSTTFSRTITTSYARYTGTMTRPAGAAYFKVRYVLTTLSQFVRVDTTDHKAQTINDELEPITDASKVALLTDPTTPRYLYDTTGVIRGKEYAQTSVIHYDAVNTGGAAPVSINIQSSTGDVLFLPANGADTSLASSAGVAVSAATGSTATLTSIGSSSVQAQAGGTVAIIGATAIAGALSVSTALTLSGVSTKTATFTADGSNAIYVCNAAGAITANLPAASGLIGRIYTFININTGKVTIDGNGSETIDGITTYPLQGGRNSVTLVCTGAGWYILNQGGLILQSDGTRWLGPLMEKPFTPRTPSGAGGLAAVVATLADAPIASDRGIQLDRITLVSYQISGSGANYWTFTYFADDGANNRTSLGSVNTSAQTMAAWRTLTLSSFSANNFAAAAQTVLNVDTGVTGSPGNIYPAFSIRYREIYT